MERLQASSAAVTSGNSAEVAGNPPVKRTFPAGDGVQVCRQAAQCQKEVAITECVGAGSQSWHLILNTLRQWRKTKRAGAQTSRALAGRGRAGRRKVGPPNRVIQPFRIAREILNDLDAGRKVYQANQAIRAAVCLDWINPAVASLTRAPSFRPMVVSSKNRTR